jgi:hypothetical protein
MLMKPFELAQLERLLGALAAEAEEERRRSQG